MLETQLIAVIGMCVAGMLQICCRRVAMRCVAGMLKRVAGSHKSAARRHCACHMCCSVLQCVAVCCSVLQSVAVCCSVLKCVVECCNVLRMSHKSSSCVSRRSQRASSPLVKLCVLQVYCRCIAVYCSVLRMSHKSASRVRRVSRRARSPLVNLSEL